MEVFINYRAGDGDWAAMQVDDRLSAVVGRDQVFRCSRSIELGIEFPPEIWAALRRCSILLALIGPHWLAEDPTSGRRKIDNADDYVRREIATALEMNLRVIPVLLGNVQMPDASLLPDDVAPLTLRQYVRLHTRESGYDLDRLVQELGRWLPAPAKVHPRNPAPTAPVGEPFHGGVSIGTANVTGNIVGRDQNVYGSQSFGAASGNRDGVTGR